MNNTSSVDYDLDNCNCFYCGPRWDFVILNVIFFIIGFVGNICLIFITPRFKSMRTVPNYLILNLAVVDLVFLFSIIPHDILDKLYLDQGKYYFFKSVGHCKFNGYLRMVFLGVSIFTLTALSVDRYLAVSKPLACRAFRSGRNRLCAVILGITFIWVASGLFAIYSIAVFELSVTGSCSIPAFEPRFAPYTYVSIIIFLLIPSIIISASYCSTAKDLLKPNQILEGQSTANMSKRQHRQRLRLAIAVIIIVTVFVTTWSLNYGLDVVAIIDELNYYMYYDPASGCVYKYNAIKIFEYLKFLLIRTNSVINPIILFILSSSHRRYLIEACFCCCPQYRPKNQRSQGKYKSSFITLQSTVHHPSRKRQTDSVNVHNIADN